MKVWIDGCKTPSLHETGTEVQQYPVSDRQTTGHEPFELDDRAEQERLGEVSQSSGVEGGQRRGAEGRKGRRTPSLHETGTEVLLCPVSS